MNQTMLAAASVAKLFNKSRTDKTDTDPSLFSKIQADESQCAKIGDSYWSDFYKGHSANIRYGLRVMVIRMIKI